MQSFVLKSWEWWKKVARKIGDFQARILLTIFYFIFFSPFAVAIRLLSDPLSIKHRTPPSWGTKSRAEGTLIEQAKRQF